MRLPWLVRRLWCWLWVHDFELLRVQWRWWVVGPSVVGGGVGQDQRCRRCGYRQDWTHPNVELFGEPEEVSR